MHWSKKWGGKLNYAVWFLRNRQIIYGITGVSIVLLGLSLGMLYLGHWISLPSHLEPADAVVVMGGARNRTLYGISLVEEQELAPELWHTGWKQLASSESNREQLARESGQAHALSEEAIRLLVTTSTWEDGQEIAALAKAQGVQHVLIVTDWHHSRRSMCVVRHHLRGSDITASFASALPEPARLHLWWRDPHQRHLVTSEAQKLIYYGLRYGLPVWRC